MNSPQPSKPSAHGTGGVFITGMIFFVLAASPLTVFLESTSNTLENNGRWRVTKRHLSTPIIGAERFWFDTQALADRRLNLGAWHGFQEVTLREPQQAARVEFDLFFKDGGWLVVRIGATLAFRLSTSTAFPHAVLQIDHGDRFVERQPIERPNLLPNHWHTVSIRFTDDRVSLSVLGSEWAQAKTALNHHTNIGFRGGSVSALVDNVVLAQENGDAILIETFDNHRALLRALPWVLSGAAPVALFLLVILRGNQKDWNIAASRLIALLACIAAVTIPLGAYLQFVAPAQYPRYDTALQDGEAKWLKREINKVRESVKSRHSVGKPTGTMRLFFVGTSQTYGVGAYRAEEQCVNRLADAIASPALGLPPVECINAAVAGDRAGSLLRQFEDQWLYYAPDVVVINLSVNDRTSANFAEDLQGFAEVCRSRKIELLFVLEATAFGTLPTHDTMRAVGASMNVPVLDAHRYLESHYDQGFLWWDGAHPTSYGHGLIAEFLLGPIVDTLRSQMISSDSQFSEPAPLTQMEFAPPRTNQIAPAPE